MDATGHISIIGTSYLQPIATLLEKLTPDVRRGCNDLQASPYENSYSASIIILSAVLIESILARVKKLEDDKNKSTKSSKTKLLEYIRKICDEDKLINKVIEIFVLRDAVVHNHIWESEFTSDDYGKMQSQTKSVLQSGYGDKKFVANTENDLQKTKCLKMNTSPTRICFDDVVKVLGTTVDFLSFLE